MIDEPPPGSSRRHTHPGWPCPEAAPAELAPGTLVGAGRFVVGALIGRGGMATVYAGHDRRLGRDVALKVMLAEPADAPIRVRRFEREAELVARLPLHRGLLRWLGAGRLPELGGRPFLATERVPGPTLAFHMAAALCMHPRDVVRMGLGLAEALAVAHAVGIVHRDLTARNVVLGPVSDERDGPEHERLEQPVLVDFGLAARVEPDRRVARLTRADQRPGTVTAMAPEQYRGAAPHPAMDVYALGRLLHQMLTGEDPHATVSRTRLLDLHREGVRVVPRLAGWDHGVPSSLGSLIDACTEPMPRRRPSAEEVCGELRALVQVHARAPEDDGTPATVISLPRPCSTEVPVLEAAVRSRVVSRRAERSTARWGWISLVMVGVVALARGEMGAPSQEDGAAWSDEREGDEVAAVAWPSAVVPLAAAEGPRGGRSESATMHGEGQPEGRAPGSRAWVRTRAGVSASERLGVSASETASSVAVVPRRPSHTTTEPSGARCEARRHRARDAARRWAWAEVLGATSEPECWPEASARMRLRLMAWIEQQRFDVCVDEGSTVRDPGLVRLVERCRRRFDRTAARLEGAPP